MERKTIRSILEGTLDFLTFTGLFMLRPKMQQSSNPKTREWGNWLGAWKGVAVYMAVAVIVTKQLPKLIFPVTVKEKEEEIETYISKLGQKDDLDSNNSKSSTSIKESWSSGMMRQKQDKSNISPNF